MYTTISSRAYITNCTFERNSAPNFGAAVYVEGSSRIKIISSTFQHNAAPTVRHVPPLLPHACTWLLRGTDDVGG